MDIDEKIFHFAWKTKRRLQKRRVSPYACQLHLIEERLALTIAALLGRNYAIKKAEINGGLIGASLFLPEVIDVFDDQDKNYKLYLLRILCELSYQELGFIFKENKLSPKDINLISLLISPIILNQIRINFPKQNQLLDDYVKIKSKSFRDDGSASSFFNLWALANIDASILEHIKTNKNRKDIIKNNLLTYELNFDQILSKSISTKNLLHQYKISFDKIELLPFLAKIPTPAQLLVLKNIDTDELSELSQKDQETTKEAKSKEHVKFIELDEKDPDCNPANLLMEGIQTTDLFSGGKKMVDGSDEMDDHFDSIEDLNIQELTRSKTQTHSIFNADISFDIHVNEIEEEQTNSFAQKFFYDEWDYKNRKYKKSWCQLYENNCPLPDEKTVLEMQEYKTQIISDSQNEIKKLKHKLDQILIEKRQKPRQKDGGEFDLDAIITAKTDLLSKNSPSENLYISKRKSPNDIALLFLIDSSLSAGSYVLGQRVIDIAKYSLTIAQEVLSSYFSQIMVASFYSNTRKNCHFDIIKDFKSSWASSYAKLDFVKPTGYTRIGVSLRHSFKKLEKARSKKKVVILLSDGKPTDYDAYEGKIGISDVRQCIREANQRNIFVYSLAIDKDSKYYFPQLFGAKNYQVLNHPNSLPEQLITLLGKLL